MEGFFTIDKYLVKFKKIKNIYIVEVWEKDNPVPIMWRKHNVDSKEEIIKMYTNKINIMTGKDGKGR